MHGRSSAGIVSWWGPCTCHIGLQRILGNHKSPLQSLPSQHLACLCQPASLFPGAWLLRDGQPEDLASLGALLRSSVEPPAINVHSPCRHPVSRAPLSMAFWRPRHTAVFVRAPRYIGIVTVTVWNKVPPRYAYVMQNAIHEPSPSKRVHLPIAKMLG